MKNKTSKTDELRPLTKHNVSYRYSAKCSGGGNTWSIYDNHREVTILKSISPMAQYNKAVCEQVVSLLNNGS
jgi:hypothetical protein